MTSERRKQYPFDEFEPKWQRLWDEAKAFRTAGPGDDGFDPSRPKFYVLDMFPYPSGQGLHVGHPEGYTATDIVARYQRMQGCNVLHPMGWDAFGLPAEQYAIKTGQHPRKTTEANIEGFRAQLKRLGFAYDWDREVNTTDPGYFKWTQWIFLQLYHSYFDAESNRARPIAELEGRGLSRDEIDSRRLAYVTEAPVWWCEALGTVLANEEVVDGRSEVGGHPVERRPMRQWMLRITAYAQRLIDELEGLDWPEGIKLLQRNWIGRSEGAEVRFQVAESDEVITVFTTRADTLFGATYMVLAPEHRMVDKIVTEDQLGEVERYRERTARKSDLERTELAKEKTGVFTGAHAVNPVNGERIPIWIADYVLLGYGTGAIMAVPAHDQRDWEFATKFGLPIRHVVALRAEAAATWRVGATAPWSVASIGFPQVEIAWCESRCLTEEGVAFNSSPLIDGLPTAEATHRVAAWLEEKGLGRRMVTYKLRDWLFSRQRYWGEPFPIVWEGGRHRAVSEAELPVLPPDLADFKPTGTPEPPLSKATAWVRYSEKATRELNTMPQWAGSCWYYLRYCDPKNSQRFVSQEAERYWMGGSLGQDADAGRRGDGGNGGVSPASRHPGSPSFPRGGVDLYIGGTEHAVLHLLYARFWHKVLFDLGHLSTHEPFQKLVNQGLILGEDSQKMSKSRGNVVNPDDVVADYGADSLRLYEMFMGPLEQVKPWSMKGVEGVYRFLARVWRLVLETDQEGRWVISPLLREAAPDRKLAKVLHETIRKVGEDIERLSFNTAISQMMVLTNAFTQSEARPPSAVMSLLQVLNPFAPHLTEELAERIGAAFPDLKKPGLLAHQAWPAFDPAALVEDEVEIVVQVNGKKRDLLTVAKDLPAAELERRALASAKIQEFTKGLTIRKVIVVPNKLVNIVAS